MGVPGRAIPGYYPAAKDVTAKRRHDSEAGPGRPLGLEWVVMLQRPDVRTHPSGARSVPMGPPWCSSSNLRLLANKGEI